LRVGEAVELALQAGAAPAPAIASPPAGRAPTAWAPFPILSASGTPRHLDTPYARAAHLERAMQSSAYLRLLEGLAGVLLEALNACG
jgi:hypothetical protein